MRWKNLSVHFDTQTDALFTNPSFNEFTAVKTLSAYLPKDTCLHLGNSMAVRYVSYLSKYFQGIHISSNRGTSGIDGSLSTGTGISFGNRHLMFCVAG